MISERHSKTEHTFTFSKEMILPLKKEERDQLRDGQLVTKVFHPVWRELPEVHSLLVIVGKNPPNSEDPHVRELIARGWHVCPFPVVDAFLNEMEEGRTFPSYLYAFFEITLVPEELYPKEAGGLIRK